MSGETNMKFINEIKNRKKLTKKEWVIMLITIVSLLGIYFLFGQGGLLRNFFMVYCTF